MKRSAKEAKAMPQYIAAIRKAPGTDYWIDIPDIPGCVARGETIDAAKASFQEALALHLDAMRADDLPVSLPCIQLSSEDFEDSVETYLIEV